MKASITVLGGDGIGPEVIAEGVRCLNAVASRFAHQFKLVEQPFGGAAIELTGTPLPEATLQSCLAADAILLGAVGGPNGPHRMSKCVRKTVYWAYARCSEPMPICAL
jgi:3-isopropylmalate dehydrogenase